MKNAINRYFDLNPLLVFFPFLILFILIILNFGSNELIGDEVRYFNFANNILAGFYSPPSPDINLWNGPGYPLFLTPFVWLQVPLIFLKLTNAFLQYFSIILLFKAVKKFTSKKYALIFSFSWAFYYISYQELYFLLTEPLTSFLCALIVFLISRINDSSYSSIKYHVLTGFSIGLLALTKIIFGYVLISMIFIYIVNFYFYDNSKKIKKIIYMLSLAFLINIPYLVYTYNLTDKILYWGNSGGSSLYWMSTPIEGEFGEWNNHNFSVNCGHDPKIPCNASLFAINHSKDFEVINQLVGVAKDDKFKEFALRNIKKNPLKYLRNCISNVSRMFFGIPNSYFYQREQTILRILPNSVIFSVLIFCSVITAINFKTVRVEIKMVVGFIFLYLLFSTLVSAYPRQFYVIVPLLFFWFSYVISSSVVINLRLGTVSKNNPTT
jgi:hypothetical protein